MVSHSITEGGPALARIGNSATDYGKSLGRIVTPYAVDFLNPAVDVSTSLWTTTVNGYSQLYVEEIKGGSRWSDPSYTDWKSYTLGYDWSFHKNVNQYGINRNNNIENDPVRVVEVISNTVSVNMTILSLPSLIDDWVLDNAVKIPITTGVQHLIDQGLETQK